MKIQKHHQLIVISSLTLLLIVYIQFKKTIQARTGQQREQAAEYHALKQAMVNSNTPHNTTTEPKNIPNNNMLADPIALSSFSLLETNESATIATFPQKIQTKKITITNGITKNDVAYKKMGTHHPNFETKINGIVVSPSASITIDTADDHLDITYSYTFKGFGRIIKQDTKTVACPLIADNHNVTLGFSWQKEPHVFLLPNC